MISRPLHFKTILLFLLASYLILLVGGYIWIGDTYLFDARTAVLSFLLGMLFVVAIALSKDSIFPHVAMATALFLVYVFPRILTYIFAPEIVAFPFGAGMTILRMNASMTYVLAGTAMLLVGMFVSNALMPEEKNEKQKGFALSIPLRHMLAVFIFIAAFELFVTQYLGVSAYGKLQADKYNTVLQLMKALFSLDTFVFVALCVFFLEKKYKALNWQIFIVILLLFYGVFVAWGGSRGFAIRVAWIIFGAFLVAHVVTRINAKHLLIMFLMIMIAGGVSYKFATIKRINLVEQHRFDVDPPTTDKLAKHFAQEKKTFNELGISTVLAQVLNRLAILDFVLVLPEQPANIAAMEKYMTLPYAGYSILNVLPGTPFPEAKLSTSRVPSIIYRGFSEEYVLTHGYFSEYWTMWILALLMAGWWYGLIVIFGIGLTLQTLFTKADSVSVLYGAYFKCFLLVFALPLVYFSMGIDHTFLSLLSGALQTISVFVLLNILSRIKL